MSLLLRQQALATLGPGAFLATVVSIQDPENQNRVQLRVYDVDGVTDQDATVWARVAVPFAGGQRGSFFIPDVGDEVVVVYLSGDPRFPIVIGGLWNGADSAPETIPGDRVDRWTITGTQGTKIAIVEDSSGPTISFTTPGGLSGTMTDSDRLDRVHEFRADFDHHRHVGRNDQCANHSSADHGGGFGFGNRAATQRRRRHGDF